MHCVAVKELKQNSNLFKKKEKTLPSFAMMFLTESMY